MTQTALFVALIAVCAQICIPTPLGISLTLQTFAVSLCGYCLTPLQSAACCFVYILLGCIGVPVFSSFAGGISVLVGKSGGYILGFIVIALLCSLSKKRSKLLKVIMGITGAVMCHIIGVLYMSVLSGKLTLAFVASVSLPLLIKDVACIYLAKIISDRIIRTIEI